MAKTVRKTAKIFGSTPGANQIAQFGSLAFGTPAYSVDPAVIQSLSQWLTGWFSAVIGANSPAIEDMNAFCYVMAYQIYYILQTGVGEWDSGTTYYIGSVVQDNTGILYTSLTNTNLNNALTDGTNWRAIQGYTQNTSPLVNVTIPSGYTQVWPNLTIPASVTWTVNGTLMCPGGLTVSGTLVNNGLVYSSQGGISSDTTGSLSGTGSYIAT